MKTVHLKSVDSTNAYAKAHYHDFGIDQVVCVCAEHQTAGRGRFGRSWFSPRSENIYATFVFTVPRSVLHLTSLAQVMALSVTNVLMREEELYPRVKWPNDVLLNGKKVAGVLCETQFDAEYVGIFIGVGVNVNMTSTELKKIDRERENGELGGEKKSCVGAPSDPVLRTSSLRLDDPSFRRIRATSLREETGRRWDCGHLLKNLQSQFLMDLDKFKQSGFGPFRERFDGLLAYRGEKVCYFDGIKEWVGICRSVAQDGQLELQLPNGEIKRGLSGDLFPPLEGFL